MATISTEQSEIRMENRASAFETEILKLGGDSMLL
jgi:hypothetical protein